MGTGITDARGEIASSGAGIPAFIGVLDKSVKAILRKFPDPATIHRRRRLRHQRPVLRWRHAPQRRDLRHAGLRRRRARRLDGQHRPLERHRRHDAGLDVDRGGADLPGGPAAPGDQGDRQGRRQRRRHGHHDRQLAPPRLPPRRHVGGDRGGPHRRAAARRDREEIRHRHVQGGDGAFHGLWRAGVAEGAGRASPGPLRARRGAGRRRDPQGDDRDHRATSSSSISATTPTRSQGPHNASRDGVIICAQMAFKALTAPEAPANGGSFRPLKVLTRPGSIFDAKEPAAHGFYFEVEVRVFDLMLRCLAPHMPDLLPAGNFGSICGTVIGGPHPDTGRHFTIVEPQVGGWGGRTRPRRQPGDLLGLPRRDLQLPGRGRRVALRPLRRPGDAQPGGAAARAAGAAAKASASTIAFAPTAPG